MKTFDEIKNEFVDSAKIKGVKTLNPVIVAMIGSIGSGKSTLTRELGKMLGWKVIAKDKILLSLYANICAESLGIIDGPNQTGVNIFSTVSVLNLFPKLIQQNHKTGKRN